VRFGSGAVVGAATLLALVGGCGGDDDPPAARSTPVVTTPESKVRVEPLACEIEGTTVRYRASIQNDEATALDAELEAIVQEPKGGVAGSSRATTRVEAGTTGEVEVVVTLGRELPDGGICAARVVRADPAG
jgi:hypothetical protein